MRKSVRTVIYTLVIIKQQKLEFLVNASGNCCLIWSVYFKAIITFVHIGLLLITLAVIIGIQKTRLVGWWQAFLSTNLADLQLFIDFLSSVHSLIWTSGHVLKEYTACEVFFKEAHHSNAWLVTCRKSRGYNLISFCWPKDDVDGSKSHSMLVLYPWSECIYFFNLQYNCLTCSTIFFCILLPRDNQLTSYPMSPLWEALT